MTIYGLPIIGPRLVLAKRMEGEGIGRQLIGRGYHPERVAWYALNGGIKAVNGNQPGDALLYHGMALLAIERVKETQ